MKVRAVTQQDLPMIATWAEERGCSLPVALLSSNGFLVEDDKGPCAACWVYLFFEVPIATVDHFVTRPGVSLKRMSGIWEALKETINRFLTELKDTEGNSLGYRIVRVLFDQRFIKHLPLSDCSVGETSLRQILYTF